MLRGSRLVVWLRKIGNEETLLSAVQEYLSVDHNLDVSIQTVLTMSAQFVRRDVFLSNARDVAETSRDLLEFAGDRVPPSGLPLGWVSSCGAVPTPTSTGSTCPRRSETGGTSSRTSIGGPTWMQNILLRINGTSNSEPLQHLTT